MSGLTPGQNDRLLAFALSIRNSPRCYVALVGAGLSIGSGIPAAWKVTEGLARQVATANGESPDSPLDWYEATYGEEATYEGLFTKLGPSTGERAALLRPHFKRSPDDDPEDKQPGPAHHHLAALARLGLVRVFITTNFDLLIEDALREPGLDPHTIGSESDWLAAPPLDTVDAVVIHIHGVWKQPDSLRNTKDELSGYPDWVQRLLSQVLAGRGYILAGWSGKYDPALRQALIDHQTGRYSTFWLDLHAPTDRGADLLTALGGIFIEGSASEQLASALATIEALAHESATLKGGAALSVARAKREIARGGRPLEALDRLGEEITHISALPEMTTTEFNFNDGNEVAHARRLAILSTAREAVGLTMTLAAFGSGDELRRLIAHIRHLGRAPSGTGGLVVLQQQRRLPGLMLLVAAGIGAASEERWDVVNTLLTKVHVPGLLSGDTDLPLARVADLSDVTSGRTGSSQGNPGFNHGLTLVHDYIFDINSECALMPASVFEESWDRWEYLWHLSAWAEDQQIGAVPHFRVEGRGHAYRPAAARWLSGMDPDERAVLSFFDEEKAAGFDTFIAKAADEAAWSTSTDGTLWYPSGTWRIDEMGTRVVPPAERAAWTWLSGSGG